MSGGLSLFYFPRRVAAFVPAFALLEAKCYRLGLSERKAVTVFYKEMLDKIKIDNTFLTNELSDEERSKWEEYYRSLPTVEWVDEYTQLMYRGGMSFRGWNFPNICYPEYKMLSKCQAIFLREAKWIIQL